jgi:serine/threonine protein kinase
MAPELFAVEADANDPEDDVSTFKVTRYSDIWSFAMLALELLTGELPFPDKALDAAVIYALMKGERPKHPRSAKVARHGLDHELWQYLRRCWELLPTNRHPLHTLHKALERLATQWRPISPSDQDQIQSRVTVSCQY